MIRLSIKNKIIKLPLFSIILLSAFAMIFSSCEKKANKIGAEIMPENSKLPVFWTDTSSVYAYSEVVDSVRSDNLIYNYFGSMVDPVFGSTTAGIYTQFSLTSLKQDFGPNPQLDSLVLQIAYAGYYGDTTSTIVSHAYEIQEDIEYNVDYFSNLILDISSTDYLNYAFNPRPNDTTTVIDTIAGDTTLVGAVQRFNLSNYNPGLGNKLLSVTPDDSVMFNTTNFAEFFKGLYLVSEPTNQDGILLRFDLLDSKTGMILYYKNDTADSLKFGYNISSITPRVSRYQHNYYNAESNFISQIIDGDTSLGIQKFYTQGLAGIRSAIKFPFLREWSRKGKIGINEAKLIFTGFEEEPYNGAPAALLLVKATEDGDYTIIEDQYVGESYYDGVYKSNTNEYVFRITNHLQSLISDTSVVDYGLYLYTNASSINPKRFIFNGTQSVSDTTKPFRLEIIYTDLN